MMPSVTDLALRRTFLAYDRTLMAWIRTSVSLISFGFSIYKFFQYLAEAENISRPYTFFGPRQFALSMIGIGVLALGLAAIDYNRTLKMLREESRTQYRSMTGKLAAIIVCLGLGLLIIVLLHL
jgi:putative membrane protein